MAQRSFEKDLERLEQVVKDLEEGELALDDSLKRFEEGVRLARACEKALAQAEKRIEVLSKDSEGNLVAEPLDAESEDGEEEVSAADDVSLGDAGTGGDRDEDADEDDGKEDELLF